MPRGSRIAVVADPGRGKSSFIKNALCRSSPWAAVYVIHGAAGSTEYDLVTHTKLTWEAATPEFFAAESAKHKKEPLALIVDDCAYADLSRKGLCMGLQVIIGNHHGGRVSQSKALSMFTTLQVSSLDRLARPSPLVTRKPFTRAWCLCCATGGAYMAGGARFQQRWHHHAAGVCSRPRQGELSS